jgi:hypothetical protein
MLLTQSQRLYKASGFRFFVCAGAVFKLLELKTLRRVVAKGGFINIKDMQ